MKWDVTKISTWTSEDYSPGATIPEAGNSDYYITGGWRSERPVRDDATCTNCLLCWIVCPDSSIAASDGQIGAFDYDHCKGCGICAAECPVNCISMENEQVCLLAEEGE